MTPELVARITTGRLALWAQKAIEQHSTPVLMLSVGHDHTSGQLSLHMTEEVRDAEVLLLLQAALRLTADKVAARVRGGA